MSDSSSESLHTTPERANKRFDEQERYRSLSLMPTDKYYDASPCGAPGTRAGQEYMGPEDLPRLSQLHQELLGDNMRLWECLNIIRCSNNRLSAFDILRKIYAISDDEFYKRYPAYAAFQTTGHGSLDSLEPGGGLYEDQKYVLHLTEHNSGLMRENARLKHCVHLLNAQPERTADEVVSHCFSLNDEDFIKYYPKAERNCRLQASLKRLREESKRHRTISLPTHILNFRVRPFMPDRPGPSRTNNNDRSLNKSCPSAPVAGRMQIDPVYKEGHAPRDHGRKGRAKKPCSESHYTMMREPTAPLLTCLLPLAAKGRCRSHSPGWQASPGRRSRSKSAQHDPERNPEKRPHSSASRQVPYMLFQHPYNWATTNESPPPTARGRHARDSDRMEAQVPAAAERDVHRKNASMTRVYGGGKAAPLVNSYKPAVTNPKPKRHRGPKISFSTTPASPLKASGSKTAPGFNTVTHTQPPSNPGRPRFKSNIAPSPSLFPALVKENSYKNKPPMMPRRNTAESSASKCHATSLPVTPKKSYNHLPSMPDIRCTLPPKRPASETSRLGRNAQSSYGSGGACYSQLRAKRNKDGEQILHVDRTPKRFNKKVVVDDQRHAPYIPPLQLDSPPRAEEEVEYDTAAVFVEHPRTRSGKSHLSVARKTSTPRLSRLRRAENYVFSDKHDHELNESRKELLNFRNSYCSLLNSVAEFSPDSLEVSPEGRGECSKRPQRMRSPRGQSKERYQDLFTDNPSKTTKNNGTYSRSLYRQHERPLNHSMSNLNYGNSLAHEPTQRIKDSSVQILPREGYFLSNEKQHRIPTRRPLYSFRESWLKKGNFKIAERFIPKKMPFYQNENTNRDTSSLSSTEQHSGSTPEDAGHLDVSPRYGFMETVEDVFSQLVREKRQLYEKYEEDSCASENAENAHQHQDFQDIFELIRNYEDYSTSDDTYQEKTSIRDGASRSRHSEGEGLSDLYDKRQEGPDLQDPYCYTCGQHLPHQGRPDVWDRHQERSSVSENDCCTCDSQEQYPDDFDPYRTYGPCDQHEDPRDCLEPHSHTFNTAGMHENDDIDSGFRRRRSNSDPSPRVFSPLDVDSRKHLSFADPLCRTYVSQLADRTEALLDQSEENSEEESIEEVGLDSEPYSESIERLRAETEKLKERTKKCRQDRERWTRGLCVDDSYIDDDGNVVCPQYPEGTKKRKGRFQRDTNTNATHDLRFHPHHHHTTTITNTPTPSPTSSPQRTNTTPSTTTTIPTNTTTTTIIPTTTTTTTTITTTQPEAHSQDNAHKNAAEADSKKSTSGSNSIQSGGGFGGSCTQCTGGSGRCNQSAGDSGGSGNQSAGGSKGSCTQCSGSSGGSSNQCMGGSGGSGTQCAGGSSRFPLSLLHRVVKLAEEKTWSSLQAPQALLGEVAYQLENRIIQQVFKRVPSKSHPPEKEGSDEDTVGTDDTEKRHRFYGFTVLSLPQKIRADCKDPKTGRRDSAREARLLHRFQDVISYLRHNFGYHVHKHGKLCQQLIQKHGVFNAPPDPDTITRLGLNDFRSLRNHVFRLADSEDRPAMVVLLECLNALGQRESQPVLSLH